MNGPYPFDPKVSHTKMLEFLWLIMRDYNFWQLELKMAKSWFSFHVYKMDEITVWEQKSWQDTDFVQFVETGRKLKWLLRFCHL